MHIVLLKINKLLMLQSEKLNTIYCVIRKGKPQQLVFQMTFGIRFFVFKVNMDLWLFSELFFIQREKKNYKN